MEKADGKILSRKLATLKFTPEVEGPKLPIQTPPRIYLLLQ